MSDIRILKIDQNERISYDVEDQPVSKVEGIALLVQIVVNRLVTTPGSDALNEEKGAGLVELCRQHRLKDGSDALRDKIRERVARTEEQIIQEQSQLNVPDTEKLKSLNVIKMETDDQMPTQLNIHIGVESVFEQTARLAI